MNRRAVALCTAALLVAASSTTAGKVLPVYIEDNQLGPFIGWPEIWISDQSHTLVLSMRTAMRRNFRF
jgi:hypothetical protein